MKNKSIKISVRSRNKSCSPLKELRFPVKVILRLGSTTPTNKITNRKQVIEINSPEACKLSGNKIDMKKRFVRSNIPTAPWFMVNPNDKDYQRLRHYFKQWDTIIMKHKHSSKGNGIYLLKSIDDFYALDLQDDISNYIFERYYTYSKEYRIHVCKQGCFHACRKMLKTDAVNRWHRHDSNSVWILEENELFKRPSNWDDIVTACVNALKSLELDVAAFDVKVQNDKHENPKFIILESNSAPSLGEVAIQKYNTFINNFVFNYGNF